MTSASLLHLKQELSKLSERERVEIGAYLHRLKQQTPAWQKEMARRLQEMDQGAKIPLSSRFARTRDTAA